MNNLYRDQLAKVLRKSFSLKNGWDDIEASLNALAWFALLIKERESRCPDYSDGRCLKIEKHPKCQAYSQLRKDIESS